MNTKQATGICPLESQQAGNAVTATAIDDGSAFSVAYLGPSENPSIPSHSWFSCPVSDEQAELLDNGLGSIEGTHFRTWDFSTWRPSDNAAYLAEFDLSPYQPEEE